MNKPKKLFISIVIGLIVAAVAIAFTGPGNRTPGSDNPDSWIKNNNDIYYNPAVSGNVGIGTIGPVYKLDVRGGQINTSGGLCIADDCKTAWSQVASTNYWTLSGSSLYPNLTSYNLGIGTASLDANYKITTAGGGIKAVSSIASQPAGYFDNPSGYSLITGSGNVGIGTAVPVEKMHVSGGNILLDDHYSIKWGGGSTSINGENPNNKLHFITANSERMTIDSIGNVGIGTVDPGSYKLKVAGTVSVNSGANIVYRCTIAGTLPVGALTINSGNCGASANTGLSVN